MSDELPKLFTDEEFGALHKQRKKADRSAHDIRGEGEIRPAHKPTDGLPESTIEQKFPQIAKKLTTVWRSEGCTEYISSLTVADRPGRQGFPLGVMEDLMMLYEINDMLISKPALEKAAAAPTVWGKPVRHEPE